MAEEGSSAMYKEFSRRELYGILQEFKGKEMEEKFSLLEEELARVLKCPEEKRSILNRALRYFNSDFKKKWVASSYKEQRFLKNNAQWLISAIKLPYWSAAPAQKPGRPNKSFEELCDRSKRRKTKELREQIPAEELIYAAGSSQRAAGNIDASKIIKQITVSPTRATKVRKAIACAKKQTFIKKHNPQEALAIFVEGDFTRRQYEVIHGANRSIYPCYSLLKKAKLECYPKEEAITVSENCAEIELQALLDHTALRLHKYVAEVVATCSEDEIKNLVLISKWGCDGSQQSQFKQKFQNITDSDSNIFQSSFVPIRLVVVIDGEQKKIIWQNPVPSSVRFCRPIRIRFIKETKDVTTEEIRHIEEQAENLNVTEISTPKGLAKIKHTMVLTMIDGKVCNAATNTVSTMRCYICGQTSKDFNKLIAAENINAEALKFGLSILHARIRFFESLLHLSYKIPIKKWQARSPEEKKIVQETKLKAQRAFKEEVGLLVDVPKPGFGNTNDGNTARRFFADPETSSRITGVNIDIIKRFKVILEVISSGNSIDVDKFAAFAHQTAKMYVELYEWHPMSPTIHKVLIHGAQVIAHAIVPIGQLSEEAAEARNKHFRQYRLNFSRKFSRVDCNRDIINRLLLSSDPYISSNRPKQHKKTKPFSTEAINLMVASTPPTLLPNEETSEIVEDDEDDDKEEENEYDDKEEEYEDDNTEEEDEDF